MSVLTDLSLLNFDGQALTIADEQIKVHEQALLLNVCRELNSRSTRR